MNKYNKLISNSFIFALGNLGSKLIGFIMVPLYTFYLSTENYGVVDIVTTTVALLLPMLSFSISEGVLRYAMERKEDPSEVLTNAIKYQIISCVLAFLLFPILMYFNMDINLIIYLIIILCVQMLQTTFAQFARAIGQVKVFAFNGVLMTIVIALANVIFMVFLKMNIDGYLLSIVLANVIGAIYIFFSANLKKYIHKEKLNNELGREMLRYSIPLIPNSIMWWVINGSSRYMVVFFIGTSANGLFAVANKIPGLLSTVTGIFNQAWQMSAIEEYTSKDKSKFYSDMFNVYSEILFLGSSFILAILIPFFRYAVDQSFFMSWTLVPFLLLAVIYSSFATFLGTNYIAAKQTNGVITTSIIGGVISLVLNLLLIPVIGVNGAGFGSAVGFFVMWILRIKGTKKFVDIKLDMKPLIANHIIFIFQVLSLYFFTSKLLLLIQAIFIILNLLINRKLLSLVTKVILKKTRSE